MLAGCLAISNRKKRAMASEDPITDIHLRQIFQSLDINGDGALNLQELNDGLSHCGLSRRTMSLFQVLDTDNQGVVDWEHFKRVGSGFLSVLEDGEGGDEEKDDEGDEGDEGDEDVVDFVDSEQQLTIAVQSHQTRDPSSSHQRSRSQALPKKKSMAGFISKEEEIQQQRKSWNMVQHEIAQDVRMRQWERLQALQAENEELRSAAGKRTMEIEKLNDKVKEQKQVILAISTEADEHIHDLEHKLAQVVSKKASSGVANPAAQGRRRGRRISCLERLRSREEEEEEKQRNSSGSGTVVDTEESEREKIPLLHDLRLLTKTNEELHVRVRQRESEYKVLASGLIKHHRRLKSAHERHERLIVEIDKISEEWCQEDEERTDVDDRPREGGRGNDDVEDKDYGESRSGDIERLCHEFQQSMENVSLSVALLVAEGGGRGRREGGKEGGEGTQKIESRIEKVHEAELTEMVDHERLHDRVQQRLQLKKDLHEQQSGKVGGKANEEVEQSKSKSRNKNKKMTLVVDVVDADCWQSFPSPSSPRPPTIVIPCEDTYSNTMPTPYHSKSSEKKNASKRTSVSSLVHPPPTTSKLTMNERKKKKKKKKKQKNSEGTKGKKKLLQQKESSKKSQRGHK